MSDKGLKPRRRGHIYMELEDDIREQYRIDMYDPNMYNTIKALAEKIILFRKYATDRQTIDEIAHQTALHMWTMIKKGRKIEAWTKYLMLELPDICRWVGSQNTNAILEITDPIERQEYIQNEFGPRIISRMDSHYVMDYLAAMSGVVLGVVKRLSHTSDAYGIRCLYLSVLAYLQGSEILIGMDDTLTNRLHVQYVASFSYSEVHIQFRGVARSVSLDDLGLIMISDLSESRRSD